MIIRKRGEFLRHILLSDLQRRTHLVENVRKGRISVKIHSSNIKLYNGFYKPLAKWHREWESFLEQFLIG